MFDGNVRSLKSRLEKLCTEKSQKERSMAMDSAGVKDWGEVSDVRLIYVYIYIYMYVYIHIYICIYICICI
jgi:hypothetical protein